MTNTTEKILTLLDGQLIIPVVTISNLADAVPLAESLVKGGLRTIEVTLRTSIALEAIRFIKKELPAVRIGAGTVLSVEQFQEAEDAGAQFIVSPGMTSDLIELSKKTHTPWLPGAITPGEVMKALSAGLSFLKFFPAESAGGVNFLKSLASAFADIKFCPTGGISKENATNYLKLTNVACLGGSWMIPSEMIKRKDWNSIESLAREAFLMAKDQGET